MPSALCSMLKNYFLIALRNLWKNKVFSLINVVGLAVGMACCLLILLYVQRELSYDKQHDHASDLYRLVTEFVSEEKTDRSPTAAAPVGPALKQEFPEIAEMARVFVPFFEDVAILKRMEGGRTVQSFYETKGCLADSTYFRVFSYDFLEGNPAKALDKPNSVVLTEAIARRLYGDAPALNRIVRISSNNGDIDFKVTGVVRPKGLSHLDNTYIMSLSSGNIGEFVRSVRNFAVNNMFYTYVKLRPGASAKALEAKFPAFIRKYMGEDLKRVAFKKNQYLESVPRIHLYSDTGAQFGIRGSIQYVYIFATVALFTLLIACINFMNLSTARSGRRAAEVGVRKVMGAGRESLIGQFLGESMVISFLALLIAVFLVELTLPAFNRVAGTDLSVSILRDYDKLLIFVGLALLTGILAGSYPAFYLSSFNPVQVLKGKGRNTLSAARLRRALVVFQFALSIMLIVGSMVIWRQMQYLRDKDLGFVKDHQLVIPLRTSQAQGHYEALKQASLRNTGIVSASAASSYPGIFTPGDQNFFREGRTVEQSVNVKMNHVNFDFLETMGFHLLAGRFFSPRFPADTAQRLVLNEEAVSRLGYTPQNIVGQRLYWQGSDGKVPYYVVGVVRDFHFMGLQQPINPFGFVLAPWGLNYMVLRVRTDRPSGILKTLEASWKTLNPDEPFEYRFLDQDFQKNYQSEEKMGTVVGYFTFIAILIASLGLYGLAAFTAEQKVKEIGVRKVLGASVGSLVALLSKDFLKLVLAAFVVAVPLSWYAMDTWLQEFAFRTSLSWWLFAIAGCVALFIALLTISSQTLRAARVNPVKSLKSE
jgi:putative ABC transport system permease protein